MAVNAIYKAYSLLEKGKDVVVAMISSTEGSSPRHAGSVMVFDDKGNHWGSVGGGALEAAVMKTIPDVFASRQHEKLMHFSLREEGPNSIGMACGGDADVLIGYYSAEHPEELQITAPPLQTAYVFGCGHIGLALDPVLRSIGFHVVMIDDRPEYADKSLFPEEDDVVAVDSYEGAFDIVTAGPDSYVIIVTRGHRGDYAVLRDAVQSDCAYVGMIGSRRKNSSLFDMLRQEGVSEERIARVYAPIGESIYAETPEEIAISIAAELIRVRSGHGTR
jgi:xanthine dehydrogenase accessory factor